MQLDLLIGLGPLKVGEAALEESVACGVVLYETPPRDVQRLARSVKAAAAAAGVSCRFLAIDNSDRLDAENFAALTGPILLGEFVPNEGNLGFGKGHNRLMARAFGAGADHYLALNPDGFLHPDALRALLVQSALHQDFALIEARQFPNEHPKIYDPESLVTPWCSGACLMIPKRLHAEIGGFDNGFFMYCEDVDYSWRARLVDAPCVIAADAFFHHDILDRPQSDSARWHMAMSMQRLLSKWANGDMPPKLAASLAKMLSDAPMAIRRTGSSTGSPLGNPRCADVADFKHFFGFAPFRWT